ncbi:MAG: gamma-glutamyltransferase family protein, partial [Gammaproteobacteria bacterium]|nr:gamma-glutamyltransferase family protein [Gammaproteobacteria bacterium]
VPILSYGLLNETLRRLADAGPRDFYEGEIAARILGDASALGIRLTSGDLSGYDARVIPIDTFTYRDATIGMAPGLTAGPTFRDAMGRLEQRCGAAMSSQPNAEYVTAYAEVLTASYAQRFATLGDYDDSRAPTCTSHISVADRHGNVVALTQTLLSIFGSKVVLPQTGILMNNGVMWFDPRPGQPNSMAPGKRPLSNMCPVLIRGADGSRFALGASGGRRIMPAVLQLASGLVDFKMPVDHVLDVPRIDVSGSSRVAVDDRFDDSIISALRASFDIDVVQNRVYPNCFACPNVVGYDPAACRTMGAAFIMSPWAGACAE